MIDVLKRKRTLKTYSHLAAKKRMPTEYEIVTSDLLYYVPRGGFEVRVPLQDWYDRYQKGSGVQARGWSSFQDPDELTYGRYTETRDRRESFVDGVFDYIEKTGYDRSLSPEWIAEFERQITPLRYLWHGFQMIAAYVGHMAPESKISVVAMFQATDEMRRIQGVARRMGQLRVLHPEIGEKSRQFWEKDPEWQPIRKKLERLLITWDWFEALVGLNLCLKPELDRRFLGEYGGDPLLGKIFYSYAEDADWHGRWARRLVDLAIRENPTNERTISQWIEKWKGEQP